jgi:hypothetical protein
MCRDASPNTTPIRGFNPSAAPQLSWRMAVYRIVIRCGSVFMLCGARSIPAIHNRPQWDQQRVQVQHPRWRVWRGIKAGLDAEISTFYGERFLKSLSAAPKSAFIAEGSPVTVRNRAALPPGPGV